MPGGVSNPRDLTLLLLGELLHVERRLVHEVIEQLAESAHDEELQKALREHREETKAHADRLETAFRRLEAAPSANLSRAFESAVQQHDDQADEIKELRLADLYHAQAALHTEHWEIAAYKAALAVAPDEAAELLRPSLAEEEKAAKLLEKIIGRLVGEARAR